MAKTRITAFEYNVVYPLPVITEMILLTQTPYKVKSFQKIC